MPSSNSGRQGLATVLLYRARTSQWSTRPGNKGTAELAFLRAGAVAFTPADKHRSFESLTAAPLSSGLRGGKLKPLEPFAFSWARAKTEKDRLRAKALLGPGLARVSACAGMAALQEDSVLQGCSALVPRQGRQGTSPFQLPRVPQAKNYRQLVFRCQRVRFIASRCGPCDDHSV